MLGIQLVANAQYGRSKQIRYKILSRQIDDPSVRVGAVVLRPLHRSRCVDSWTDGKRCGQSVPAVRI